MISCEERKLIIAAIKVAVGNLQMVGVSPQETLVRSIILLNEYYIKSGDECYLEKALLHIESYLELGFAYDNHKMLFDTILSPLNAGKEVIFPIRKYPAEIVKLNKSKLNIVLGKWYPNSREEEPYIIGTKPEIIQDIIEKITERKEGIYLYKNGTGNRKVFQLVINSKEHYLYNLLENKYYEFLE